MHRLLPFNPTIFSPETYYGCESIYLLIWVAENEFINHTELAAYEMIEEALIISTNARLNNLLT